MSKNTTKKESTTETNGSVPMSRYVLMKWEEYCKKCSFDKTCRLVETDNPACEFLASHDAGPLLGYTEELLRRAVKSDGGFPAGLLLDTRAELKKVTQ